MITVMLVLGSLSISSTQAQTQPDLVQRIAALEKTVSSLEAKLGQAQHTISTLETKLQTAQSTINTLQATQTTVQPRAVSSLDPYVRVETGEINGLAGPHIIFEGANVHIRSGAGITHEVGTFTGLGNLVVGYNEEPSGGLTAGDRGGAHNLIIGPYHRFLSAGGLVAGALNTISGQGASVSGGRNNTASNLYASVSGGQANSASGASASISGGRTNMAYGDSASISGGYFNAARGSYSSISGGYSDSVTGSYDWRAGDEYWSND
jgi:hypothetical protein